MLERSAGYGLQQVDRDGLDVEIAECEGKFDPLFHSFTHADDASAAEVHPYSSCGMQGFQLLFLCMRGTERVEVGRSRFEVTVVAGSLRHHTMPATLLRPTVRAKRTTG